VSYENSHLEQELHDAAAAGGDGHIVHFFTCMGSAFTICIHIPLSISRFRLIRKKYPSFTPTATLYTITILTTEYEFNYK
jgi:hypothetical protein